MLMVSEIANTQLLRSSPMFIVTVGENQQSFRENFNVARCKSFFIEIT